MMQIGFKCPGCGTVSEAARWDGHTVECCVNRAQRRSYVPIAKANGTKRWYKCPSCGKKSYSFKIQRAFITEKGPIAAATADKAQM